MVKCKLALLNASYTEFMLNTVVLCFVFVSICFVYHIVKQVIYVSY